MAERINAKHGFVTIGGSGRKSSNGWFIWPSDTNSLMAGMVGALVGPFPDEETAKKAAADIWYEVAPDDEEPSLGISEPRNG